MGWGEGGVETETRVRMIVSLAPTVVNGKTPKLYWPVERAGIN